MVLRPWEKKAKYIHKTGHQTDINKLFWIVYYPWGNLSASQTLLSFLHTYFYLLISSTSCSFWWLSKGYHVQLYGWQHCAKAAGWENGSSLSSDSRSHNLEWGGCHQEAVPFFILCLCTLGLNPQRPANPQRPCFYLLSCLLFLYFLPLNLELNTSSPVSVYHQILKQKKTQPTQLSIKCFIYAI